MPERYDATGSFSKRPPNWGLIERPDVRVEVTHTQGTAAVLTWMVDGDTVREARFKSVGLGDCTPLMARAIGATQGKSLALMAAWQVKQLAQAAGVAVPASGPDRLALELALLAIRNALHVAGGDRRSTPRVPESETHTICYCMDVTEATILDAIRNRGATTVEQVSARTGAVGGCGTCRPDVAAILVREGVTPREDDGPMLGGGPPWANRQRNPE